MKQQFFFTVSILVIMYIFGRKILSGTHRLFTSAFMLPLIPLIPRKCDSYGCGNFGASRDGGKRSHMGQDYISREGQPVFSPIRGSVSAGAAYADGRYPELRRVTITGTAARINLMYVLPDISVGQTVEAGELIGYSQSLQNRYPGIPDHVHVEVSISGVKVDPIPYFKPIQA